MRMEGAEAWSRIESARHGVLGTRHEVRGVDLVPVVYLVDGRDRIFVPIDTVKPKTTTVYKWRDAAGNWQISDQPPGNGTEYETLEYHRDANVMPADRFVGREE